jgi:DNA-binding response OmpR family regulator
MRDRAQLLVGPAAGADRDDDDRQTGVGRAQRTGEGQRAGPGGFDQSDVGVDAVDGRGLVPLQRNVAESLHRMGEEIGDLAIGVDDQNPGHVARVAASRLMTDEVRYECCMDRQRVLVVDDEEDIRTLVRTLLERAGKDVVEAPDGRQGLRALHSERPSLVILDVTMPELDGWATLERIRDLSDVPVLMLTARGGELDTVRGLRSGADDYLSKPFGRQELLARVEALLRRSAGAADWTAAPETYGDGQVSVDVTRAEVRVGDREIQLTPLEFRLLVTFMRNPGQVLGRDQLLDLVWGHPEAVDPGQVKVTVSYLRRKLGAEGDLIRTVRGFGYRWGS